MLTEVCGSSLLLSLPDDVFSIVSRSLAPRDLCNLCLCCRSLCAAVASEKVWLTQCEVNGILAAKDLMDWRMGMMSYKALCRFLSSIEPLIGIWVHQNPELGNVVYVMPGFVSVVGCRIIPQELGPLGIEDGPILWAPVFEILGDVDGSPAFFLHGREKGNDYFYPGLVKAVDKSSNVLLLEVDMRPHKNGCCSNLLHSKSFVNHSDQESRKICRSNSEIYKSPRIFGQPEAKVPFGRLAFSDRRKLLETVMSQVRVKVPDLITGPLFPRLRDDEMNFKKDMAVLSERRSVLMQIHKVSGSQMSWKGSSELLPDPTQLELSEFRKSLDGSSCLHKSINGDDDQVRCAKRKTLGRYLRQSLNQILGKSGLINDSKGISKNSCSSSANKYVQLEEFLKSGDTIGLALHASTMKLSSYRGWPNMHDSRFALYKLPMRVPTAEQEYAGLWGGTFGWPPGKPTEDKPGKALFFLLLSYEKSQGQLFLIATKILEGTHYVLHPNGSAMFRVNINEPSADPFPWESDGDLLPVNVRHTFTGEGIANGYGFRYPGSKPGSLYVFQNGQLAFIWKESRSVLTLQRLNLQELLKKGERVPSLPPTINFSYLTKSYSNVFTGFPNTSTCFSSPRETIL